jgi:ribosomal protein S18 acetylase RimI-like enzyme
MIVIFENHSKMPELRPYIIRRDDSGLTWHVNTRCDRTLIAALEVIPLPDKWYIRSLWVGVPFRRQGIATRLLKLLIKHAQDNQVTRLELENCLDSSDNKLYERVGFTYKMVNDSCMTRLV